MTSATKNKLRDLFHENDQVEMRCRYSGSIERSHLNHFEIVSFTIILGKEDYTWYSDRICFRLPKPVLCKECGTKFVYAIIQETSKNGISSTDIYGAEPEPA